MRGNETRESDLDICVVSEDTKPEIIDKIRYTEKTFRIWLHKAFDLRHEADYKADSQVTEDQAEITLENAVIFVNEVRIVITELITIKRLSMKKTAIS